MSLLLLNEDELRQTIAIPETIDVVKAAFVASARGRMNIPGNFMLKLPEVKGTVNVKGAYLQEAPYFVIRVGSNFHDNPLINLPTKSGLITVFDAATGFPAAIMIDNGYLSTVRAGAAGALATEYLANKKIEQIAVIGSGNQAYMQLKSLMNIRSFNLVSVWARSPLDADNYARRMVEDHDLNIRIVPSVEAAVQQADIIITATASTQPLIKADWLKPGVHITAIGSNNPAKQELETEVLERADVIIVDSFDQCATSGEIHHGLYTGVISKKDIHGDMASLIDGKIQGRTDSGQITLADLTGLDAQDAVVARLAMEKALFLGLGQRIEVGLAQQGIDVRIENLL
jgi:ornithine cyclodeaminase